MIYFNKNISLILSFISSLDKSNTHIKFGWIARDAVKLSNESLDSERLITNLADAFTVWLDSYTEYLSWKTGTWRFGSKLWYLSSLVHIHLSPKTEFRLTISQCPLCTNSIYNKKCIISKIHIEPYLALHLIRDIKNRIRIISVKLEELAI